MTEINTDDNREYQIRKIKGRGIGREYLTFDVKCQNDAHIALLGSEEVAAPMIEIFIGGWRNQKSAIRLNQAKPDKAVEPTADIVSPDEFRRFWISFRNDVIRVGMEGDEEPFMSWENTDEPFKITHFGFATGWGATGTWIFDNELKSPSSGSSASEDEDEEKIRQRGKKPFFRRPGVWLDVHDGKVPIRAVLGGMDATGEKIYVGRAKLDGALLPGKIVPSHSSCYISCDGVEHGCSKFQALVRNKNCELVWIQASDGSVPLGALQGGYTAEKEPVFIGRIEHDGVKTIGSVQPSLGKCSASYGGEELSDNYYDVLVVKYLPL